ncbi:MAG TPA: PEGA domain-containing protein, partial [Vicinamibacterales bacterium]|nr:PEGA domain-containing protein [Vicinamibacterales bacterium]
RPTPTGPPPERRPGPSRGRDRGYPPAEQRVEAEGFGELSLRVQPADAVVTIDGDRWDTPEGGSRLQLQLSEGSHRVEVTKDGHRPYTTTIDVRRGETVTLNVSLPRIE